MYEIPIEGEIKALGYREGSSGVFTGSIEGLYQGYRLGSDGPDIQQTVLELPYGTIALTLRQELPSFFPLSARPAEHPFAQKKDPFESMPAAAARKQFSAPALTTSTGAVPPPLIMNAMDVRISVDESKSTGIFKGASGEMQLTAPFYRVSGYLVVETRFGNLRMNFLEKGNQRVLSADLEIDGEHSTGLYQHAQGTLQFSLALTPPNFARGPYSGIMRLQHRPPDL